MKESEVERYTNKAIEAARNFVQHILTENNITQPKDKLLAHIIPKEKEAIIYFSGNNAEEEATMLLKIYAVSKEIMSEIPTIYFQPHIEPPAN